MTDHPDVIDRLAPGGAATAMSLHIGVDTPGGPLVVDVALPNVPKLRELWDRVSPALARSFPLLEVAGVGRKVRDVLSAIDRNPAAGREHVNVLGREVAQIRWHEGTCSEAIAAEAVQERGIA